MPRTAGTVLRFVPEATGTHLLRAIGNHFTGGWARNQIWEEGSGLRYDVEEGDRYIDGSRAITFHAGLEYRILVRGTPSEPDPPFRFGVFDLGRTQGCGQVATAWGADPATGSSQGGALDCYAFTVDSPGKYRLQVDHGDTAGDVMGLVAGPGAVHQCGATAPGGLSPDMGICRLQTTGSYRLIAGLDGIRDPSPVAPDYEMYVSEVDSPGCPTVPLARWNAPLPVIAQADGAAYECYEVTTGATSHYALSGWRAAWSPRVALWEADPDSQMDRNEGLPVADGPLVLQPHTRYRVVVHGDREHASGEHRLGLFELKDLTGCPAITNVSWSAPPTEGTTTRGELDCRLLPGEDGDLFHLDSQRSSIRNVVGDYCPYEMCTLEGAAQWPWRVITSGEGDYEYRVSRVADRAGCPSITDLVVPESSPLRIRVEPGGRACFAVDLDAALVKPLVHVDGGSASVRMFDTTNGWGCPLDYERYCSVGHEQQVVVVDAVPDSLQEFDAALLLRQHTATSVGCEQMATARVTGELSGRFDEECFTLSAPEGTLFSVATTEGGAVLPDLTVYGPDGDVLCDYPFTDECRAPGGRMTISLINKADTTGPFV